MTTDAKARWTSNRSIVVDASCIVGKNLFRSRERGAVSMDWSRRCGFGRRPRLRRRAALRHAYFSPKIPCCRSAQPAAHHDYRRSPGVVNVVDLLRCGDFHQRDLIKAGMTSPPICWNAGFSAPSDWLFGLRAHVFVMAEDRDKNRSSVFLMSITGDFAKAAVSVPWLS